MSKTRKLIWFYIIGFLFITINGYLLFKKDTFLGLTIPLVVITILLYLFEFDKVLLIIALTAPLAINLEDNRVGVGISIPTEILLFGVMIMFLCKLLYERRFDRNILRHPLTIAIIINLVWIFITCVFSVRPLVSFKFLVARLWFVIPMFFVMTQFVKDPKNISRFLWCYILPLIIVCIYTLVHHAAYGFTQQSGNWVVKPFYNDHTEYGAALALFIPLLIGFSFSRQYSLKYRLISLAILVFLVISLIMSFCRAAWLSLALAAIIYLLISFKIRFRLVLLSIGVVVGIFFTFQHQIIYTLEKNQDDSSSDFSKHIRSMTNISTDASNLERLNRWGCAIRMFEEKPFLGWGPGTYQFEYAPYQTSSSKTIASTSTGDLGNAHSEYFGPLAESGVLGMLTFMVVAGMAVYYGIRVYRQQSDKKLKQIALLLTIGLITYLLHGVLNNFLNSDKLSVPFWGFIAILVTLDVYKGQKELPKETSQNIENE